MEPKGQNTNKKMGSISRKIHMSYWFRQLFLFLFFDIVIIALCGVSFMQYTENKLVLPEGAFIVKREIADIGDIDEIAYVVTDNHGELYVNKAGELIKYSFYPFVALFGLEFVFTFTGLFGAGKVRRKLKPLNELAKRADILREYSLDPGKMHNLEEAISKVDLDSPTVETGDKELLGIETALNNLLKQMKESERAKTRFVSDASHELRTPIAVIQGYVNMLDRWGKEDEEVLVESIEALKNESDHMKELVEQLLFLARGDSGRNTLNMTKIDLSELVNEVYEESLMIDEGRSYSFEGFQSAFISGDVAMIKQSVRIFVQNAAKYSDKDGRITFKVEASDGYVSYVIQDEGIGMDNEAVKHIFERFYRSDEARNSETGGSGLGLSIAKWIIEAHNGRVEVFSVPDVGTKFIVSFPEYKELAMD